MVTSQNTVDGPVVAPNLSSLVAFHDSKNLLQDHTCKDLPGFKGLPDVSEAEVIEAIKAMIH